MFNLHLLTYSTSIRILPEDCEIPRAIKSPRVYTLSQRKPRRLSPNINTKSPKRLTKRNFLFSWPIEAAHGRFAYFSLNGHLALFQPINKSRYQQMQTSKKPARNFSGRLSEKFITHFHAQRFMEGWQSQILVMEARIF